MASPTQAAKEHFKSQNLTITLYPTTETKTFKTLELFRTYIEKEHKIWDQKNRGSFANIQNNYNNLINHLNTYEANENQNALDNIFSQIVSYCQQSNNFISSETAEGQLLYKLYSKNFERAEAAYSVLIRNGLHSITSGVDQFIGNLTAINLKLQKEFNEEISEELPVIENFRARYEKSITEAREDYIKNRENWESEINLLQENLDGIATTTIAKNSENQATFEKNMVEYEAKIIDLEKTYGEKLRLSKPVEYWELLQKNYESRGKGWIWWTIGTSSIFVLILIGLFFNFPEWLKGTFGTDQLKGLIIFTLIVSTFSYVLHLFIKLANSAYHLSRDAEERKQLTHVYLALLKEKAIEENERAIILQSLFSRADTGLLKNDGAPTMPMNTSIIDFATKLKK